ncbi:TULIP family P47-like protein [Erwinia pyrifoliae]|uniref:TULIP family P47-like protein n=1 Tax=Erwinia pyrifoliae TaxID=79967 RepID=UPI001CF3B825|nr:TULIP family P47-like protein [Erwinia pyrifoliae]
MILDVTKKCAFMIVIYISQNSEVRPVSDISTSGWDVVSITNLDTINKIISSGSRYPSEFSINDTILGSKISINGKWGRWLLTSNASGGKVNIKCEIAAGTVDYEGSRLNINDNSNDSYLEIELSLKGKHVEPNEWVMNDDIIDDNTCCYQLVADSDNQVVISSSVFSGSEMKNDNLNLILPALFGGWFKNNLSAFDQIFAVILIGLRAKKSDFQWLYPSAYSYAANSSLDNNTTGFGILTLVDGRTDTGNLQQSVDISALRLVKKFGANLALVISKEMFVKHMLLKAAVDLIKNATASDFTISNSGLSLTNRREMLWQDFHAGDNKYISPILPKEGFILTLQSDYIHLTIQGAHYRPHTGVTVYMGLEQNFRYKVANNARGEPVFVPDEKGLGDAQIICSVKFDKWLQAVEITMGVIASIAAIISLGTLAYGAITARAAATLVAAEREGAVIFSVNVAEAEIVTSEAMAIASDIVNGTVSNPTIFNIVRMSSAVMATISGGAAGAIAISEAIYKSKYDDIPSFHHFASIITGTSVWPHMDNIKLKSASLADSFVIGLEIK